MRFRKSASGRLHVPDRELAMPRQGLPYGGAVASLLSRRNPAEIVVSGDVADPTQLPLAASGVGSTLPNLATVGALQSGTALGGRYTDPYGGVRVTRLTNNTRPGSGSWEPSYSEGGPSCSLPWESGGVTFYTVAIQGAGGTFLMDINYDVVVADSGDPVSNVRAASYDGEVGIAFSLDPAQPRIAYLLDQDNKRVNRYNTQTNAIANTGNWPWNISAAGSNPEWLHAQLNDVWFACMLNSNQTLVAFKPSTGVQRSLTVARSGAGSVDELRVDREDPTVYVVGGGHAGPRRIWHLETDTITEATDLNPPLLQFEHAAPIRGGIVMHCCATQDGNETPSGSVVYRSDIDQTINFITTPAGSHGVFGDFYTEGHWCYNLPTSDRAQQWVTAHLFDAAGSGSGNKIRNGMMAWVKLTGEVRLMASHGSVPNGNYDAYPQCFTSPDGKLLFWTSNMNNSARYDTFMARMPTS